jgi:hypothetical protein
MLITANQLTLVERGARPTPARSLTGDELTGYLEGLQPSGIEAIDDVLAEDGVLGGRELVETETPGAVPPPALAPPIADGPGERRASTPGDAAGQPIPALEGAGGIGVPF